MKHFRELFIAVLILALFWAVFNDRVKAKKLAQYETLEQKYKAKFDSLKELQHKADVEAILALTDLEVARNQLRDQSRQVEKFKFRYETLRRTAAPDLTDAGIDSAVARLYPIR